MESRRDFLKKTLGAAAASAALGLEESYAVGRLAWPGPIGLEMYTVRDQFAKAPAATLKAVAAAGYKEIEAAGFLPMNLSVAEFKKELAKDGLTSPSGFLEVPKTTDQWKKSVEQAKAFGWKYVVVAYGELADAQGWKRLADLFNQCGRICRDAGIQFCYHNHLREFAKLGSTCGYDILLTQCDPALVKMEMDVFWITYAGADPLPYFKRYAGRFPLLHIKDMKKDAVGSSTEFPPDSGPNPFAPVGQGKINWPEIFAHVHEAGAQHIFVEQDRADTSPLEAIKTSYDYLRTLRLS
ncbi:MAG TPA: sugar phosphate isomerase/epimerase [Terriglobia bacterium]|nr:sugar phosphate isomerase/epimerase [Terriglobia bacterium]